MIKIFVSILNMSLMASYTIIFVIIIRILLKKAPTVISYALWGVVAFRLVIPFSVKSTLSIFNFLPYYNSIQSIQPLSSNNETKITSKFITNITTVSIINNSTISIPFLLKLGTMIWLIGIVILLLYIFISILTLKRKLRVAQWIELNIYEVKNLKTPFVFGLIKANIYLPAGINAEERKYVLLHEQIHIQRKDHIIKILAFFLLLIHWFNPFIWIAFILMSFDMELSCDENVLKNINEDIKQPYANSLLALATEKHIINRSPLAFGGGNIKLRIKNVLNYKKPTLFIIVLSIIVFIATEVTLMTNPKDIRNIYTSTIITSKIQTPNSVIYLAPFYSVTEEKFLKDRATNKYQFNEKLFEVKSNINVEKIIVNNPIYQEIAIGEKINVIGDMSIDISNFNKKQSFQVFTSNGNDTRYIIYKMDAQTWISHWGWYGENNDTWWCEYIINVS